MSDIHQDLIKAYEGTEFRVLEPTPFTLRIGVHAPELGALYADLNVTSAGFLTAWNPFSTETSQAENRVAQLKLIRILSLNGFPTLNAFGVDPSGAWPGEDSVFVPGLELDEAKAIGIKFGQNAVVWAGLDAVPQLVLLR